MLHAVNISPIRVQNTLKIKAFFLPWRSAYSPRIGAPKNCPKENAIRNNPRMAARVEARISGVNKWCFGSIKYGAKIGKTMDQQRLSIKKVKNTEARERFFKIVFSSRFLFYPFPSKK